MTEGAFISIVGEGEGYIGNNENFIIPKYFNTKKDSIEMILTDDFGNSKNEKINLIWEEK